MQAPSILVYLRFPRPQFKPSFTYELYLRLLAIIIKAEGPMVDAKWILGILGNVINILMLLSPASTFWNICKNKSTQQSSGLPYVVTLFNCLLWLLYGMPRVIEDGTLLLTINGVGVGIKLRFLTLFLVYADRKNRVKVVHLQQLTIVTIACITLLALKPHSTRKPAVGSICTMVTITMYVAPLSVMKMVIQTKSVAFMPFLLSLFMVVNTSVWTGYGVVSNDIFVTIPNCVGLAFGIAQLALHAVYGRNKALSDIEAGPEKQGIEVSATKATGKGV